MHIDARELEDGSVISGDICIIGAGVAGISIALQWINTPYKVILLEGGGFEYDEKVQSLYDGKITGQKYYPMMSSRLHYFGGTSGHWGGLCSQFDDLDFSKREWVPSSGWPINKDDLLPFYNHASQILDLPSPNFSEEYWRKKYQSLPMPLDSSVIQHKVYQKSPPTRFGEKYKETIINADNIFLYTYANATELILTSDLNAIGSVITKNYTGRTHTIKADVYICACSALQNARLLLASNRQVSEGIGNRYDLVGRYFMEHLEIRTSKLFLNHANPFKYYRWHNNVSHEVKISDELQEKRQILNATMSFFPLEEEVNKKPNMSTWMYNDPRKSLQSYHKGSRSYIEGRARRIFLSGNFPSYEIYTRMEQTPNENSRLTLNNEKDSLGMPKVDLHWQFTSLDKKTLRESNLLLGQQLGGFEIGRLKFNDFLADEDDPSMPDTISGGWHHIGTTKMNSDVKKGVVDKNCKVHSVNNLYIAGSSCFPTAGSVTPTLTVVAISLRLSNHIRMMYENKQSLNLNQRIRSK